MSTRVARGPRADVAAVFPHRAAAREAAEALCAQGADTHIREALDGHERRVYELDLGAEVRRRVTRGALVGLPAGAVVGALLIIVALAGTELSGGEAMIAGGLPGLVGGIVFGAFAGLVRALWVFDDIDRWMAVPLRDTEVLVIARDHGDSAAVRRALRAHGGHLVDGATPSRAPGRARRQRLRGPWRSRRPAT